LKTSPEVTGSQEVVGSIPTSSTNTLYGVADGLEALLRHATAAFRA
jgi:hypothetical protein